MEDNEFIEYIHKHYQEIECMKCFLWDLAAREHGKRGMCGECFDMHYIPPEMNFDRLGTPLLIQWKTKEEAKEFWP